MQIRFSTLVSCVAAIPLAVFLSGCAMTNSASPTASLAAAIRGNVHGGQQPVIGAHVYLLAANNTAYGAASISLLSSTATGLSDSIGAYVLTKSDGSFSITSDYTCTSGTQVYLYALGGNPGAGTNAAAGFLAAIGQCPASGSFAASVPYIYMNEVSTVAAAYSMSGFATDALHVSSSNSSLAQAGIAIAFANAANLAGIATGTALTATPAGNGLVPQTTINTIANILATCVNSSGPATVPCTTLFANTYPAGFSGTQDTATAAIYIAHNPGSNVGPLFAMTTPAQPFAPALSSTPTDFTIGIIYSGTATTGGGLNFPQSISIDKFGDVWVANTGNSSVSELTGNGTPLSPPTGFTSAQLFIPTAIAIDPNQNAWLADSGNNNLTKFSTAGVPTVPSYTGGGLASPQSISIFGTNAIWIANFGSTTIPGNVSLFNSAGVAQSPAAGFTGIGGISVPVSVAVDQTGSAWIANKGISGNGSVSKLKSDGTALSPTTGFTAGGINFPSAVAVDFFDNIWIANYNGQSVTELQNSGVPKSPSTGYTGGGLKNPSAIAIDGAGYAWIANAGNNSVSEFTSQGASVSPATGFAVDFVGFPQAIAVDGAGSLWVANGSAQSVTQLIGIATPVATPLATAAQTGTLGSRP